MADVNFAGYGGTRFLPGSLFRDILATLGRGQAEGVFGDVDLRNAEAVVVAILADGSLAGFITGYTVNDEELFVQLVYVAPEHRRQGLGRRLFDELRRQLPDATGPVSSLVLTGNAASESFHRSIGMQAVATMYSSEVSHG